MSDEANTDITELTVQLLSAYLSKNTVASADLADLIATTRSALGSAASDEVPAEEVTYEPAVSVRKSLGSRDHIISLIDGKPYKMLKRHLALHGLTPADYRARYNLPSDYPMVAAAYSERRREVAKTLGLGRKGRQAAIETPAVEVESVTEVAAPKSAGKAKSVKKTPSAETAAATSPAPKPARKAKAAIEVPVEAAPVAKSKTSRKANAAAEVVPAEIAVAKPAARKTAKKKVVGDAPAAGTPVAAETTPA